MAYTFFDYHQNNSRGEMHGRFRTVIVEASSPANADDIAVCASDVYFDGVEDGMDCPCCGDRWYRCHPTDKGNLIPSMYGTPLHCHTKRTDMYRFPALVIYKDGRKEEYYWTRGRVVRKKSLFARFRDEIRAYLDSYDG